MEKCARGNALRAYVREVDDVDVTRDAAGLLIRFGVRNVAILLYAVPVSSGPCRVLSPLWPRHLEPDRIYRIALWQGKRQNSGKGEASRL